MHSFREYLNATRHPWAALVFVGPLLVAYETGLLLLDAAHADSLRNGADAWLRTALANLGMSAVYTVPALLLFVLLLWSFRRRHDRPRDALGLWTGMAVESFLYALVLYGLSRGLGTLLGDLGILQSHPRSTPPAQAEKVLSFLGAGIYEETLFRLVLFAGLLSVFHLAEFPATWAVLLAAAGSSLLFAAAHNVGPYGEPFEPYVFLFRSLAGIYFASLFLLRGFGIAVGAHAGYDVLVGILVQLET